MLAQALLQPTLRGFIKGPRRQCLCLNLISGWQGVQLHYIVRKHGGQVCCAYLLACVFLPFTQIDSCLLILLLIFSAFLLVHGQHAPQALQEQSMIADTGAKELLITLVASLLLSASHSRLWRDSVMEST